MLDLSLPNFLQALDDSGGYVGLLRHSGRLLSSHADFSDLATSVSRLADFDDHEAVFFARGPASGLLLSVFLHHTQRGPGAGGVRRRAYASLGELVTDGLRLSLGMGYKSALAGLWWGGGKGIIGIQPGDSASPQVYQEYGQFLSALNGCYVAAEDVGTKPEDMAEVFRQTRFTTCIPSQVGGSGNPSGATACGVLMGISALATYWDRPLEGMKVAIQGLGEVGFRLAQLLTEAGCDLVLFDLDPVKVQAALRLAPRHRASSADEILTEPVDVLAPCALGAVLSPVSVPRLGCRAVCGAANNQLEASDRDSRALAERGILYVPDFVVNRMGIVACADEQYGRLDPDPKTERHLGWDWDQAIAPLVVRLLRESQLSGVSPLVWAEAEARRLGQEPHPIWPGRAHAIAEHSWQQMRSGDFWPG